MDKRNLLGQVKMSVLIQEKVKSILIRSLSTNEASKASQQQAEQHAAMLIKYRPEKNCSSHLLNDLKISNISEHMSMHRNMRWVLLYRLSEHGVSMNTFISRLQGYDSTLLVIEEKNGHKFGGFCTEEWTFSSSFFGTGDNFVFTFRGSDEVEMWYASGDNNYYQFCDRSGFGLGGGIRGGRFALYLGNDLWRGSSNKTECFENDCLSSHADFECVDLEVWGFE